MKKLLTILSLFGLLLMVGTTTTSCSKKTGCPALEENTKSKLNKAGMPKKKAKSGLFPGGSKKKKRKG